MAAKKLPVKKEWTDTLEHQLIELQSHLKETASAVAFLDAARYYKVSPEYLTTLIAAEYQKKLKLVEKVAAWARTKGGTLVTGKKHEDGTIYSWKAKFQLDKRTELIFDIGRYHGPDIYDKPLDFEAIFIHNKSRLRRHFVDNYTDTHDLTKISDIERWYKKGVKEHAATTALEAKRAALKK